ncbi:MAG: sialidase family protein [Cyclobacteriaceae bacterium]
MHNLSASLFLSLVLLLACQAQAPEKAENTPVLLSSMDLPAKDFIFGDDKPFPQCHASNLLRLEDGNFLVVWFGGTREKDDDVGIWLSRGRPGKWTEPEEVAKLRDAPHWNPVLFQPEEGPVHLFFKVGKEIDDWETWLMTSADGGKSWTEARELVPGDTGGRGPVRNKPIVLSNGDWLAPASHEDKRIWNAFVDRSTDQGESWEAGEYLELNRKEVPEEGIIQPALWESEPGKVHMLIRSSGGQVCRSDSDDYGKSWTPVYNTGLPNPNTGIDVSQFADGTLALAYNRDDENWGARAPLTIALSEDNGQSWPYALDIESGAEDDEFSYPSIISFGDTIAVTYTWQRQKIAFWMGTRDQIPASDLAFKSRDDL